MAWVWVWQRGRVIGPMVLVVLLSAVVASAQGPRGGRGGFGMMGGRGGLLGLLRIEQIQEELKLSAEQKTKLDELSEKLRAEMQKRFGDMEKLTPEQRRARWTEMRETFEKEAEARTAENTKQVAQILQPEQLLRLKQIQLQQEGVAALRRPEVVQHLGLNKDQTDQLERLATEAREKGEQLFQGMRGGPGASREPGQDRNSEQRREQFNQLREKGEQMRKDLEQKSMAVLTADQKAKLGEMMGKPFELDRARLFQNSGDRQRGGRERGDRERGGRDRGDRGESQSKPAANP